MIHAMWDRRIRRANELTSSYAFAAEGLRFYSRVATFQKSLYGEIQKALADSPKISADRPLRDELDLFLLLPKFPRFLSVIEQIAPVPLAQAAAGLAQKGPAGWQHAIENFWHILRIAAKSKLWMELRRPARFAAVSLSSAYCAAKVMVRKNRCFACSARMNGFFEEFIVRHAGKKENRRWHTIRHRKSRTSEWMFATPAIPI
jgi:hypothetical protein